MAQAQPEERPIQEREESAINEPAKSFNANGINNNSGSNTSTVSFRFNAQAQEFVPRSHTQQPPISGYFYPCFHYLGGAASDPASEWILVSDHHQDHTAAAAFFISNPSVQLPINPNSSSSSRNLLSEDLRPKIVKQVEYQFTDLSLLANESMSKYMNKDLEGYVPISYIASTKKIKALTSSHHLVAQALRSSTKLVVSEDGKKVKRKHPFTEKDREELQFRTVVAENLPEDHSYQNLDKIFGVVGIVKAIRICHPQESNSSRPKGDFLMSNKIHALVEYENTDIAERAVDNLNDERNWRKGLRVRLLLRCSPKSVLKNRRSEFDGILDEDDTRNFVSAENSLQLNAIESLTENNAEENSGGLKKAWGKGRGKSRGRVPTHGGRCVLAPLAQSSIGSQCEASAKQTSKGPRMPDGTRGFTMGRGKPLSSHNT